MEPYTPDNVRFVLRGVNYAMHTWGEDAFWLITKAALAQRLRDETLRAVAKLDR